MRSVLFIQQHAKLCLGATLVVVATLFYAMSPNFPYVLAFRFPAFASEKSTHLSDRGKPAGKRAYLSDILTSDGAINPAGLSNGSFSTDGFKMKLAADGSPRFVPASAQQSCVGWDTQFGQPSGTNGIVLAIAVIGNDIYVGGNFSRAGDIAATGVARFNTLTNTWSKVGSGTGNGVAGQVNALAVSGNDLYVGGQFGVVNSGGPLVFANSVVRFDTLTSTWSLVGSATGNGVNSPVTALLVNGNDLYVGGQFLKANAGANPIDANHVAKFNLLTNTWSALSSGNGDGVSGDPKALAVSGNELIVAGNLVGANVGSAFVVTNNVAKFNLQTNTWSPLGSGGGAGVNSIVNALVVSGNDVYLGGLFTQVNVGGPLTAANNVAKFNLQTSTWSALGSGAGNGVNGGVNALSLNGSDLLAGGLFSQANVGGTAVSANNLAKFNISSNVWAAVSSGAGNGVNGEVFSMRVNADQLYVGGRFQFANVGGVSVATVNVAKFDLSTTTWSSLGLGGNGMNDEVRALVVSGNELFVGGAFTVAGSVAANRVAKFNLLTNTWSALGSGGGNGVGGTSGPGVGVYALAISGNELFVGGNFTQANVGGATVAANYVAKFDLQTNTWSALGSGSGNGLSDKVRALAVIGNEVFVGGDFIQANVGGNTVTANNVAKFNKVANTWSALSADTGVGVNGTVYALAVSGNDLFVGGIFGAANVGGIAVVPAAAIARFNTQNNTWSALGSDGGRGVDTSVTVLAVMNDDLYVGGTFMQVNIGGPSITAKYVARFNLITNTWGALGSGSGNGVNANPTSITTSSKNVYFGGVTAVIGGVLANTQGVAKFRSLSNTWGTLNPAAGVGMTGIQALAYNKGDLYVGGFFTSAGSTPSLNIAKFCNAPPTLLATANFTRQAGSLASNSIIANGDDDEDAASTLTVTINGAAGATINGVTVGNLSMSANGAITADVATACDATMAAFTLRLTDSGGLFAETPLTITVPPNTPPLLSYGNQSVVAGGVLTINPAVGPSDNGGIASISIQSQGTYTGTISVNNTTGIISLTNAAPLGSHTITVRATDNCGLTTDTQFTLDVGCLVINPATLPDGFVGTAYNQMLSVMGGTSPYIFAIATGNLPTGLTLASDGTVMGMLAAAGTFNFTVSATDSMGCTGTRAYTVHISGNGLQFYPLPTPIRALETRAPFSGCVNPGAPVQANTSFTLGVRTGCTGIPANATAVTGNVTVVPGATGGYLTLFPSTATQPIVASSNFKPGEVTNNVFTVGLGAGDGAFKIFASATTEVIVDVTGYYAPPGATGLYFHALPEPVRLVETRTQSGLPGCIKPGAPLTGGQEFAVQGRSPIAAPCNTIPAAARVLVGNATSVLPAGAGFLTIFPGDAARPLIASSNYASADIINGPFAVKLGADGQFRVYSQQATDLVIDILGYYSAEAVDANGAGLLFSPLDNPVRLLETRADFPGFPLSGCYRPNAKIAGGINGIRTQQSWGTCEGLTIPDTARAVIGNATVVNVDGAGFMTFYPGNVATAPTVATSNYPFPVVFGYNRHFTVGVGPADGTFKILTQFATDLIVDVSGYFAP